MHLTALMCPVHTNGGAGHDNSLPLCTLIDLVNHVLKTVDRGDCKGRKGLVEI